MRPWTAYSTGRGLAVGGRPRVGGLHYFAVIQLSERGSMTDQQSTQHDFDFIFGEWQIHNRKLRDATDPDCDEWIEFEATGHAEPIFGGLGHIDRMFVPQSAVVDGFE